MKEEYHVKQNNMDMYSSRQIQIISTETTRYTISNATGTRHSRSVHQGEGNVPRYGKFDVWLFSKGCMREI